MRWWLAMMTAAAGLLCVNSAVAQERSSLQIRAPGASRPAAYNYGYYDAGQEDGASPSDPPDPPAADAPAPEAAAAPDCGCPHHCGHCGEGVCPSGDCCDTCCNACGLSSWLSGSCWFGDYAEGENEEPWTLMDDCPCLKESGHTIAGWIEMGYQNEPDGSFTGNGSFLDDREWTSVNLNQAYIYVGKATKTEGCGCDWGYRADLIYGVDGNETQSFGNDPGNFDFLNGWDHGIYEWGMPQLYAEVAYNDLTVKLGHFYTPTGYEVVPPLGNFFFSRQITWYQGEPFTHTGALATYKYSDNLLLTGGWVQGWDTGFDQFIGGGSMALLGAAWTISDEVSLAYFGAYGNAGWRGSQSDLSGLILSVEWTEKFGTLHQFDVFGSNNGADPVAPGGNFAVDGIPGDDVASVNYIFYSFTDKLRGGIRHEWYKADGVSYNTLTAGFNVKATPNLTIRPEVRYLWSPGVPGGPPGTIANNVERVYGNNTVFGIDAVWTF